MFFCDHSFFSSALILISVSVHDENLSSELHPAFWNRAEPDGALFWGAVRFTVRKIGSDSEKSSSFVKIQRQFPN